MLHLHPFQKYEVLGEQSHGMQWLGSDNLQGGAATSSIEWAALRQRQHSQTLAIPDLSSDSFTEEQQHQCP